MNKPEDKKKKPFLLKKQEELPDAVLGWVKQNTAILVTHGIGDQYPISTLDDFARGLLNEYNIGYPGKIEISHEIIPKESGSAVWFDNVLRIKLDGHKNFIDIYEYYWANYTEDKASWSDLNDWLQGVVKGARSFYKANSEFGQRYKDNSIFFDSTTGEFITWRYKIFLAGFSKIFMAIDLFLGGLLKLIGYLPIPFLGTLVSNGLDKLFKSSIHMLTNIIGDIAIYNVVDPKSKFYNIRKQIADGAIDALSYLIEREKTEEINGDVKKSNYYGKVIVAGHSLGSQVAYDAINKLNLLINQGLIKNYDQKGNSLLDPALKIETHLGGFITFGSPLDKIVFFIRENVGENQYIKQQMLEHYHGFKRNKMIVENSAGNNLQTDCALKRLLEKTTWRNYYDDTDYVSGGLDYYSNLTNVNCNFEGKWHQFTHSNYWQSRHFYTDIINHFLI